MLVLHALTLKRSDTENLETGRNTLTILFGTSPVRIWIADVVVGAMIV